MTDIYLHSTDARIADYMETHLLLGCGQRVVHSLACFQVARVVFKGPEVAVGIFRAEAAAVARAATRCCATPLAATTCRERLDVLGEVADIAFRHATVGLPKVVDEIPDPGVVWPPASEKRHPGGGADRNLAVRVLKYHAALCQFLEIGRVRVLLPKRLQLRAQVVNQKIQHVGSLCRRCTRGLEAIERDFGVPSARARVHSRSDTIHLDCFKEAAACLGATRDFRPRGWVGAPGLPERE